MQAELKGTFLNLPLRILTNKVKNMKTQYLKAIQWQQQTGQGVDGETVRAHILKLCPHYDELDEIYSERPSVKIPARIDTGLYDLNRLQDQDAIMNDVIDAIIDDDDEIRNIENVPPNARPVIDDEETIEIEIYPQDGDAQVVNSTVQPVSTINPFKKRKQPRYVNNSISQLVQLEGDRQELLLKKHKLDKENREEHLKIEKEKMLLERERFDFEKIKWEGELKMKERLAELELRLKYGVADKQ